jgi:hypothetical protein
MCRNPWKVMRFPAPLPFASGLLIAWLVGHQYFTTAKRRNIWYSKMRLETKLRDSYGPRFQRCSRHIA